MFAVEHSLEALDLKESTSVICLTVIKTVAHFIYQIGANTQSVCKIFSSKYTYCYIGLSAPVQLADEFLSFNKLLLANFVEFLSKFLDLPDFTDSPELPTVIELSKLPKLTKLPELTELTELTELPELSELSELSEFPELPKFSELPELPKLTKLTKLTELSKLTNFTKLP